MAAAESHPNQRKVVQYVMFADDKDADGHGTHVAGIAAGKVKLRARLAIPHTRSNFSCYSSLLTYSEGDGSSHGAPLVAVKVDVD